LKPLDLFAEQVDRWCKTAQDQREIKQLKKGTAAQGKGHGGDGDLVRACDVIGICLRTLKRWQHKFKADGNGIDRRKGSSRHVNHRFSAEECQRFLLTCNEPQYASLPPSQIVPDIADQGFYIGSERSFYRVLHAHGQLHRRGRARLPKEVRPVPRLRADGPNQVWSWDISYLPTSVKGIWLYH
jgi:hypothetical protein